MGYQCVSPCCTLNLLFWVHTPFSDTPISEYNYYLLSALSLSAAMPTVTSGYQGWDSPTVKPSLKPLCQRHSLPRMGQEVSEKIRRSNNAWNRLKIPLSGAPSSLSWFSSNTTTIQQPYLRSIGPDLWVGSSELESPWAISQPRECRQGVGDHHDHPLTASNVWCLVSLSKCV